MHGIEVSWANVAMLGANEEQHSRGPFLIGIDPASPFKPATALDKFEHLQRQSSFCFKVPVVSLPDGHADLSANMPKGSSLELNKTSVSYKKTGKSPVRVYIYKILMIENEDSFLVK